MIRNHSLSSWTLSFSAWLQIPTLIAKLQIFGVALFLAISEVLTSSMISLLMITLLSRLNVCLGLENMVKLELLMTLKVTNHLMSSKNLSMKEDLITKEALERETTLLMKRKSMRAEVANITTEKTEIIMTEDTEGTKTPYS